MAAAVESDFVAVWRAFGTLRDAQLHEDEGWLEFATGRRYALLNAVLRCWLDRDAGRAIDAAVGRFTRREVPFTFWVLPSSRPAALGSMLDERGLHEGEPWPGMAARLSRWPRPVETPVGLSVERVSDMVAFAEYLAVARAAFGQEMLWQALADLANDVGLGAVGFEHYVGRLDGAVVATASVVTRPDVAGVYNIGTVEGFRGRGIGRAMTEVVMNRAAEAGASLAVLQSSPAGDRIYHRLGFEEVCLLRPYYGGTG